MELSLELMMEIKTPNLNFIKTAFIRHYPKFMQTFCIQTIKSLSALLKSNSHFVAKTNSRKNIIICMQPGLNYKKQVLISQKDVSGTHSFKLWVW